MKQMEDFVLIFEVNPKWNNSKCKRLLGLDEDKIETRGCEYTDRLQRIQDFIRINCSDTI